jgi:hypothetical protein
VPRDDERQTRPENRRPSVTEAAIARERLRQHPGAEPSSVPPREEREPPATRRSFFPRELPGWLGKAAAALFAAVVLPVTLAVTRRIDAGTTEVQARAELLKKQAENQAAQAAVAQAEIKGVELLARRVAALEALRGEVADLRGAIESTHANVAELTPPTRPPKRLKVRPAP